MNKDWMRCYSNRDLCNEFEIYQDITKKIYNKTKNFFHLDSRPFVKYLKQYFGNQCITGAEVGVFKGKNSINMLRNLNIQQLYLIDSYEQIKYDEGNKAGNVVDWNPYYEIAQNNLCKYRENIHFIRKSSNNAIHEIPYNLDFVYIDANHDYEAVLNDISLYYPKIKKGGVLGGHDYCPIYPGVARAINEYFNYPKMICNNNNHTEWWIIKEYMN